MAILIRYYCVYTSFQSLYSDDCAKRSYSYCCHGSHNADIVCERSQAVDLERCGGGG